MKKVVVGSIALSAALCQAADNWGRCFEDGTLDMAEAARKLLERHGVDN